MGKENVARRAAVFTIGAIGLSGLTLLYLNEFESENGGQIYLPENVDYDYADMVLWLEEKISES